MSGIFTKSRSTVAVNNDYSFETDPLGFPPLRSSGFARPGNIAGLQVTTGFSSISTPQSELATIQSLFLTGQDSGLVSRWDNGHPFNTVKRTAILSHKRAVVYGDRDNTGQSFYRGPLVCSAPNGYWLDVPDVNSNYYGSSAISATIPTKANTSIAEDIAQMLSMQEFPRAQLGKDILSLFTKADFFRTLGNSYLNLEFGWATFIQDLKGVISSLQLQSKVLNQLYRDNGKTVRRQFYFPWIENYVDLGLTQYPTILFRNPSNDARFYSLFSGDSGSGGKGQLSESTFLRRKIWFSGEYIYHLAGGIDPTSTFERYFQLADKLLGVKITPSVLWQLTPWTWLADWVSDLGSIMDNYSLFQQDNLVLRYGYLMCKTDYDHIYASPPGAFRHSKIGIVQTTWRTTRKERVRATPFGFGLDPATFTLQQWAILGALGISKAPRSLP